MSSGTHHDRAFSHAAESVLEHLAATSGLATWAVCRSAHSADGTFDGPVHSGHTLAVVDPHMLIEAHSTLDAPLGQDAPHRISAAISFPDGQHFGELVGFGPQPAAMPAAHVHLLASLLGTIAAAQMTLANEHRTHEADDGLSDPLTGLATRQGWEQRLRCEEHLCREFGESAAVMVVELDELKRSNELQGHSAGDEQLRLAGAVLREVFTGRHFAARITGDRLGALLVGLNDREIGEIERVTRQALAAARVPAAIGVARRHPETGLMGAITAANNEIERGHSLRHDELVDAGHAAVLMEAMERGAIKAYFQPIVDLRTGAVVALEALARWQSAEGVREPDQFLPQLARAGLLGALFDRILDDGLQRLVDFRHISPDLRLAVNLEFDTTPVNSLLDTIRDRLSVYGLPPDALSLELSERQTFELPVDIQHELSAVAEMGVKLVLDDFGTGFASLETLTTMPISGVKLDRKFTSQVVNGERESLVVKAMIALAAETGLTVIAEGIETQAQCDRLVRLGCRLGQGYLFALPQPADSLAAVIAAPLVSTF